MLTFIDKNEVYSERKFDEASGSSHTRAFYWLFMLHVIIMQTFFFFYHHILAAPTATIVLQQAVFLSLFSSSEHSLSLAGLQGAHEAHRAHRAHLHRAQLHQQLRLNPLRPLGWCATVTFGPVWTLLWQPTVASAEPLRSVSGVSENGIVDCLPLLRQLKWLCNRTEKVGNKEPLLNVSWSS